jgi:hypothetical protein
LIWNESSPALQEKSFSRRTINQLDCDWTDGPVRREGPPA